MAGADTASIDNANQPAPPAIVQQHCAAPPGNAGNLQRLRLIQDIPRQRPIARRPRRAGFKGQVGAGQQPAIGRYRLHPDALRCGGLGAARGNREAGRTRRRFLQQQMCICRLQRQQPPQTLQPLGQRDAICGLNAIG